MERYVSGDLYIEPTAANCRHCGSNAVLDFYASSDGKMFRYVQCGDPDCDQQSPLADTIEDAVSMWNRQNADHSALFEKKDAEILRLEAVLAEVKKRLALSEEKAGRLHDSLSDSRCGHSETNKRLSMTRSMLSGTERACCDLREQLAKAGRPNCKPDGEAWVVEHEEKLLWAGTSWSHVVPVLMDRREAAMMSRSLNGTKARKIQWRFADDQ